MTRLITTLCMVGIMISLSIWGIYYAKDTQIQLDTLIDMALAQCVNEDSANLHQSVEKMSAFFTSRHSNLSFFVKHDEVDKINTNLLSLSTYAKADSFENAYSCLLHIRYTMDHIYNKELPTLDTLF